MDADAVAASFNLMKNIYAPTVIYLITDNGALASKVVDSTTQPVIISTSTRDPWTSSLASSRVIIRKNGHSIPEMNINSHMEAMISSVCIEGLIDANDRAICIADNGKICSLMVFEGRDMPAARIRDQLDNGVGMSLLEGVIKIAFEIAREGREGLPAGALFIVGDVEKVLNNSRQMIINPFEGHPKTKRNLLDAANKPTIKDMAQLDGAMIIDEAGIVISAGRYLDIVKGVDVPMGLGARNLAAASITTLTKAVAVLVSSTGVVRIYKNGKIIFDVNAV